MNIKQAPVDFRSGARQAAEFLKMMASEQRLMVLCSLWEGERTVGDLVAALELRQPNVSQHLAKLRMAGFVNTRRDGTHIYYRLADETVRPIIQVIYERFCASGATPQSASEE